MRNQRSTPLFNRPRQRSSYYYSPFPSSQLLSNRPVRRHDSRTADAAVPSQLLVLLLRLGSNVAATAAADIPPPLPPPSLLLLLWGAGPMLFIKGPRCVGENSDMPSCIVTATPRPRVEDDAA
jgi:hypothetical protein